MSEDAMQQNAALGSGLVSPHSDLIDHETDVNPQVVETNPDTGISRGLLERVNKVTARLGSMSDLVRLGGVAALVLSMFLFLVDGASIVNDTQRYFSMLLLTGLLGAGGLMLALILKEQRGARAFFGLALLSVPVNFTVLGALVYSVFSLDNVTTDYPQLAEWTLTSVASLGATALLSTVALVPVTVFAMSVLARENRGWLSISLLACSTLLLLPIRDTMLIVPIVGIAVVVLLYLLNKQSAESISLKTAGGRYVRTLLFLPVGIMLIRSVWLYEISALALAVVSMTVFVLLRHLSMRLNRQSILSKSVHLLIMLAGFTTAAYATVAADVLLPSNVLILVFGALYMALMLHFDRREMNTKFDVVLCVGWFLISASAIIWHDLFFSGLFALAIGSLMSVALIVVALIKRQHVQFWIGCLTFGVLMLLNVSMLVDLVSGAGWIGLAAMGACAIVLASVIDRYGALLTLKLRAVINKPVLTDR